MAQLWFLFQLSQKKAENVIPTPSAQELTNNNSNTNQLQTNYEKKHLLFYRYPLYIFYRCGWILADHIHISALDAFCLPQES